MTPRILIGICSSRCTRERRDAVRDTWMRRLPPGVQCAFFVGDGPAAAEPDVVCLPVPDGYGALSVKVHAFYRFALGHMAFDHLFKCDDDTYVHVERLTALARPDLDFVGSGEFDSHGFASGGAGYLVSRALVERFVREPVAPRCDEDVVFSARVRRDRDRWATTDALHGLGKRFPDFMNDMVTGHWCPPDAMRRVHSAVTGADHGAAVLDLRATHPAWSGVIRLFADGVFWSKGPALPHGTWLPAARGDRLLLRWNHWPPGALERTDTGFAGSQLRLDFASAVDRSRWEELGASVSRRS